MFNIAKRNLKIFFRQKSAVFFSLLSVFIIIGLYVVFLGDTLKSSYEKLPGIDMLMNSWIIAGIVSVASITTTMGAFGILVDDRVRRVSRDFHSSPIARWKIVGGYILSSYIIGVIMTVLSLVLGEIYMAVSTGGVLSLKAMIKMLGIILVSVLASSSLVFFIVSFFSSNSAFATASIVLGTLIGFVTGIYLPVGTLPEGVQWIVKLFPVSHAGALMRQVMTEAPVKESFAGVPKDYVTQFKEAMGITYTYGDYTADWQTHIIVLLLTAIIFFVLAWFNILRKRK